jgi:hypothetical protein
MGHAHRRERSDARRAASATTTHSASLPMHPVGVDSGASSANARLNVSMVAASIATPAAGDTGEPSRMCAAVRDRKTEAESVVGAPQVEILSENTRCSQVGASAKGSTQSHSVNGPAEAAWNNAPAAGHIPVSASVGAGKYKDCGLASEDDRPTAAPKACATEIGHEAGCGLSQRNPTAAGSGME